MTSEEKSKLLIEMATQRESQECRLEAMQEQITKLLDQQQEHLSEIKQYSVENSAQLAAANNQIATLLQLVREKDLALLKKDREIAALKERIGLGAKKKRVDGESRPVS